MAPVPPSLRTDTGTEMRVEPQSKLKIMPIYKTNGKWKIKNVPGTHKTKKEAQKRLQAVKANQRKKK